jgi:hypothetical protein
MSKQGTVLIIKAVLSKLIVWGYAGWDITPNTGDPGTHTSKVFIKLSKRVNLTSQSYHKWKVTNYFIGKKWH